MHLVKTTQIHSFIMSQNAKTAAKILLASSSASRQSLLKKLFSDFECYSPDIDESRLADESAEQLALRLSEAKAKKAQEHYPDHIIIAGDQTADCNGTILGKPLTQKNARAQLRQCSGEEVIFHSGLSVFYKEQQSTLVIPFTVTFRELSDQEIENYVKKDQPLWSAGAFKCESLGIALFEKMEGSDVNALVGLPLIELSKKLRELGVNPLLQD